MAYRLKAHEPVPDDIRRIVREEIESAAALLRSSPKTRRDKAVHEARKSVKKVRGVLRLMRPELDETYKEENARFRDIGHQLSELRDAAALLEVFDHLVEKHAGTIERKTAGVVRRGLRGEKSRLEQQLNVANVIERASRTLHAAQSHLKHWPLKKDGFPALAGGLEQTYRRGRRALKAARKSKDAVLYHDFRKRVKDHWYHVRLLESFWTEVMKAHEASLKELETWLGDDHNLTVLREKFEKDPDAFGGSKTVQVFLLLIAQYQEELRQKSVSLGERIYAEKPRAFVRGVASLWSAWKDQPDSLQELETEQQDKTSRKQPRPATKKIKTPAA